MAPYTRRNHCLRIACVLAATALVAPATHARPQADVPGGYASGHVIMKVRRGVEPTVRDGRWTLDTSRRDGGEMPARPADAAADLLAAWSTEGISALYTRLPENQTRGLDRYYRVHVPEGTDAPRFAAALSALDAVAFAEVDGIGGTAEIIPDDLGFTLQYGLHNIGQTVSGQSGTPDADIDAPSAWEITTGTDQMVLAVLDAGVSAHTELGGRMLPGWAYDGGSAGDTCGSHGTHVAGIAAANSDNGVGVAGVNWNVKVQSFRILSGCSGFESSLAEGILEAIDQGVDVINMSLQYYTGTQTLRAAVLAAYDAGIPMICAAGNNQSSVAYPAKWPETIAVAATDNRDDVASFSNPGTEIDVAAPGDEIYSLTGTSTYGYKNGTSMATPFVSGLVTLMLTVDPTLTVEEIRGILISTAVDVEDEGFDEVTGWGRIDALAGLQEAQDGVAVPGDITGDGQVNVQDLVALITSWGECGDPCPADLDSNGIVDVLDLVQLIVHWS